MPVAAWTDLRLSVDLYSRRRFLESIEVPTILHGIKTSASFFFKTDILQTHLVFWTDTLSAGLSHPPRHPILHHYPALLWITISTNTRCVSDLHLEA